MRQKASEVVTIPQGVTCALHGRSLACSKGSVSVSRAFSIPGSSVEVREGSIVLTALRANRRTRAYLKTARAHIMNLFEGLSTPYVYELEICNVHFPMTVKVEGNKFVVTNFLGEKEKRMATIVPSTVVEVKGSKVFVSSPNLEAAGQTAANIEKATRILKRDRRVFQDGIFLTSKCGRPI
ncbi:MAG: 50S ribosomal protein L6 [Nanoarchaeota archaeon]